MNCGTYREFVLLVYIVDNRCRGVVGRCWVSPPGGSI